ncbi:HesA/MoeB/ThiF family protein [Cellulomonas fimi]|uniref:UBA/THIF-type NAD/FAD binding protein n=1 Tax=Cellulomonas fimi (strain ATCC 484 / DSM 20113 / JCM 1341 / CCUG 24087 / LMG 16345 / NBRC 15513 / NCIMB 8980 / NCTC 7547 / NRS-133) TaxID=590998 RepID=F4H6Y5_CELFA|nr:ThiF family adenylyltransferase [Cellulomonas fimi]AEE44494.1 UBA/THIF-type NAD/FAD binding protein [Cellulomonas fimi ATCC 484]NNH06607.1 ThiF family adenylyltransferase [Cellulomonas fimi]VEH26473.1 Molybdopterin-synthase adenylyltransferase [Cellulomonas fimi]
MVPRLKSVNCLAGEGELVVSLDPKVRVRLADPDGRVLALLRLLLDGSRDEPALAAALRDAGHDVTTGDVREVVAQLDRLGWLEDADAPATFDAHDRERYASNLFWFDAFTTLATPREEPQRRLRDAHVLVLGAGGLGSAVLMNLAGLGVGSLTVVDQDLVELRNFARQFTYTEAEVGQPKAERVADWLRAFDPTLRVDAERRRVESTQDVAALLDRARPDLVVSAIDEPDEVDRWVNAACVAAGVPFVRGGLAYTQGLYWSVDPGVGACRECLERHRERLATGVDRQAVEWPRVLQQVRVNRAIGPVAQVLGGLVALEALRFLTRDLPGMPQPVASGRYRLVDLAGDCSTSTDAWPADPGCPVCAAAPARRSAAAA